MFLEWPLIQIKIEKLMQLLSFLGLGIIILLLIAIAETAILARMKVKMFLVRLYERNNKNSFTGTHLNYFFSFLEIEKVSLYKNKSWFLNYYFDTLFN